MFGLEECGPADLTRMYSMFLYCPRCLTTAASLADHVFTLLGVPDCVMCSSVQ